MRELKQYPRLSGILKETLDETGLVVIRNMLKSYEQERLITSDF